MKNNLPDFQHLNWTSDQSKGHRNGVQVAEKERNEIEEEELSRESFKLYLKSLAKLGSCSVTGCFKNAGWVVQLVSGKPISESVIYHVTLMVPASLSPNRIATKEPSHMELCWCSWKSKERKLASGKAPFEFSYTFYGTNINTHL